MSKITVFNEKIRRKYDEISHFQNLRQVHERFWRTELMQIMRSIILSSTLGYDTDFSRESPKIQHI
jgi:hypothetical protein